MNIEFLKPLMSMSVSSASSRSVLWRRCQASRSGRSQTPALGLTGLYRLQKLANRRVDTGTFGPVRSWPMVSKIKEVDSADTSIKLFESLVRRRVRIEEGNIALNGLFVVIK